MTTKLDGKKLSNEIKEELKTRVHRLQDKGITPCLAVILVGDDPASQVYIRNKKRAAQKVGVKTLDNVLPASTSENEIIDLIYSLNNDPQVHGILVQLPLPQGINEDRVIQAILPSKDVDGFHPQNIGKLFMNKGELAPCTPNGIMHLLANYDIQLDGKRVVIVGRSKIVGMPMIAMMLNANATVTVTHSHTHNLKEITREADVVIVAVGKAEFLTGDYFKSNAVVIDVGMNRNEAGKLVGDVEAASTADKVAFITPVPGGVGPMTIAMLLKQTIEIAERSI
ncbi:bifunctional 5,10-methylene-tetrahydrofolate dehydrogenase/5,10-methylene-tetrahydrofolate cyclohydrolase [Ligilactobacillus aviarius]|uniref:bifunctional methylenetetrahydrofolate dehydrogenase/methenyltetrahydrofolate cyclohydrolase FolD n=1 Tax=Ligilactobacillus aviarius TaxID=1606 RepID=UPI0007D92D54|nr:bifunctional methylenetetrahydrofolate dehydrogenase/methenyltetrahydrofolate cyclohydrolase FolD [Ligilactobacillus aviarius]OAQ02133.1 bifunctional 5,10-methylene-tetrahydrofolate dehydrogenase/5,10-methylene-tetrahydrofolate cyclohydrolase [Ligilactobacillus aviarius]OAQ04378.1 bifunctional 5,10-methylene-tetrahydrofolate dehydrogenase/5,10-methylene-tetrahydrofolate cyclohydrolase [Ligilactobacillus aviarius]OAS77444.1 bifunctional methylenetetrahydrofolate dehydrogenase/methenyltetrahydr